jgi:hypothetical protein
MSHEAVELRERERATQDERFSHLDAGLEEGRPLDDRC